MSRFGLNMKMLTRLDEDWTHVPTESSLEGKKIVCIYFGARRCPPCRSFVRLLKIVYEEFLDEPEDIEIVYVSSDRNPEDMKSFMREAHGSWLAVPHNLEHENHLKITYGIQSVPKLIVCRNDGSIITKEGQVDIQRAMSQAMRKWLKSTD